MKKNKPVTHRIMIEFAPGEIEAWKNFVTVMKPPEVPEPEFTKQVFLLGAQFLNDTLTRMAQEAKMQHEASASGMPNVEQPSTEPEPDTKS